MFFSGFAILADSADKVFLALFFANLLSAEFMNAHYRAADLSPRSHISMALSGGRVVKCSP